MNELDFDWAIGLSDEQIRVNLKRHFGLARPVGEGVPLGWGAKYQGQKSQFFLPSIVH